MQSDRTDVLGVGFDNITMEEAVAAAERAIESRSGGYVVTPNPEIVWAARKDPSYAALLNGASLVLPDGIGIVYGARILGTPLKEKVPGIEFASALIARLAEKGGSLFLFGAKPGVAEKAAENLCRQYPGIVIAGCEDGYHTDDPGVLAHINGAAPDLLLVCLGAPKQERWMAESGANAGLMAGLGGSLDVFAGIVKRAPEAWCRLGLEWLYRLLSDPRRIGRMMKLPLFLLTVIGQRIRGR
ncbi:MAG: WecB/TagA/CpsF family glycosyltransferase [Oscillospiraceae bacterium]|nr:WecB/TagA/CpsF family glycosyltransferase [Oscillospiraceae bacterium]